MGQRHFNNAHTSFRENYVGLRANNMSSPITLLNNEALESIGFYEDKIQMFFYVCKVNVYAKLFLKKGALFIHPHNEGWRDALCEQINQKVILAKIDESDFTITFENGVSFVISNQTKHRGKNSDHSPAVHIEIPDFKF